MSQLFRRVCRLTVGHLQFTELRVSFHVTLTSQSKPNTAEITVYGLSQESRAAIVQKGTEVRLVAGYEETAALIFAGQVVHAHNQRQNGGWQTILECRDGAPQWESRMRTALQKPTSHKDLLKSIAASMGLQVSAAQLDLAGTGQTPGPVALYGFAHAEMDTLCRSLDLEWSMQAGRLLLLKTGTATTETAVFLSPETGLQGAPESTADDASNFKETKKKKKHPHRTIKLEARLQPLLKPGRLVQLESQTLSGLLRCSKVDIVGDTHGSDWNSNCECIEV